MPADPDLDALDALLKAATPGPWVVEPVEGYCIDNILTKHPDHQPASADGDDTWRNFVASTNLAAGQQGRPQLFSHNAALIAAAVNALPALLRRARIGDAAREVLECDERLQRASAARGESAMKKPFDTAEYDRCAAEFMSANRALEAAIDAWDAARALLETKDA